MQRDIYYIHKKVHVHAHTNKQMQPALTQLALPFLSVNIPERTSRRLYSLYLSRISSLSRDNPSNSTGISCKKFMVMSQQCFQDIQMAP